MISKKMENMVANSSAIRAMFEEGNRLQQNTEQRMYLTSVWEIRMFQHRKR